MASWRKGHDGVVGEQAAAMPFFGPRKRDQAVAMDLSRPRPEVHAAARTGPVRRYALPSKGQPWPILDALVRAAAAWSYPVARVNVMCVTPPGEDVASIS
jgi:hypothetical protein